VQIDQHLVRDRRGPLQGGIELRTLGLGEVGQCLRLAGLRVGRDVAPGRPAVG
jgi:hypothetical protein